MATADQVKALVKSHGEGDSARFYSVALQVAAKAARSGQPHFAQELKALVDTLREQEGSTSKQPVSRLTPVAQPRGELASLLTVTYPSHQMSEMVLEGSVQDKLDQVLLEQRQRDRLREHGFHPVRRLLLVGAPGTGKTMTASVLASELRLPLFSIRLEGLITKFMGETAAKLRLVFDALSETRGLYFFDEVDALAGERSSSNDVGEVRRVLNSFLQFLEQDESESLIIAATNHPRLLDRAIFRRFDTLVNYPLPSPNVARKVIRNRLAGFDLAAIDWQELDSAISGLSHGEITVAAETTAKKCILSGGSIKTRDLAMALEERHSLSA
ncbi:AAA family ATPase [Streptomyces sp. NPDC057280]|uniref:AAA family ATPase n=1 Tax=Streptomyces sp. NPDC057280 TaxID=3346081 RepID=UPI003627F9D3